MKTILALLALAVVIGCSAMPPISKGFRLQVTAGNGGDAINFYAARFTDTNWQLVATVPCTNGQQVSIPLPGGDVWTADTTNTQDRTSSDYAPALTNNLPSIPVPLLLK